MVSHELEILTIRRDLRDLNISKGFPMESLRNANSSRTSSPIGPPLETTNTSSSPATETSERETAQNSGSASDGVRRRKAFFNSMYKGASQSRLTAGFRGFSTFETSSAIEFISGRPMDGFHRTTGA